MYQWFFTLICKSDPRYSPPVAAYAGLTHPRTPASAGASVGAFNRIEQSGHVLFNGALPLFANPNLTACRR